LLQAHQTLMSGLVDECGVYRQGGVGVIKGKEIMHIAPPAKRVPLLMRDLLLWLQHSTYHPLIVSSVFHYEFEFIHPFADGNGRMGRLWQSLILRQWNPLWADVPIESLVYQHQASYYLAIQESTEHTDAAYFVQFMLERILDAFSQDSPQVTPQVTPQVESLLNVLKDEMSRDELQHALGLRDRKSFRELYLKPALQIGIIEMTFPDKPNSKFQKYRKKG
ncbi:MAG: Fic family protein, partial [Mariprofundaceae bacterium]|nr:Fic family protein [Mariprofundaceae bacterium]